MIELLAFLVLATLLLQTYLAWRYYRRVNAALKDALAAIVGRHAEAVTAAMTRYAAQAPVRNSVMADTLKARNGA